MSMKTKKSIQREVKSNCANYAGDGQCLLDQPCGYFNRTDFQYNRCSYFEESVLPGNKPLEILYRGDLDTLYGKKGSDNVDKCKRCNHPFFKQSNAAKYCEDCRSIVTREKSKARMRSKRLKDTLDVTKWKFK
jgi:hypothetical protein